MACWSAESTFAVLKTPRGLLVSASSLIPYQFFLMLPYILSIVAMIIMSRRASYPKALLVPFRRGERI